MKILVSACLLGQNVKYSGGNNYCEKLNDFLKGHEVISVCPEVLGGLETPRIPCERVNGIVYNKVGELKDNEFKKGAEISLEIALKNDVDIAILQPRSPSCGSGIIYDGSFTGKKIPGNGVFSEMLQEHGFKIIKTEDDYIVLSRKEVF